MVLKINLNLNEEHVRERILALLVTEHTKDKVTEYVYDKQFSDMKNYHIEFLFHYYTFQMFLKKCIDQGKADISGRRPAFGRTSGRTLKDWSRASSIEGRMTVR